MHIDDLVMRIRRLPAAKRKKLDEIVRLLEENVPQSAPLTPVEPTSQRVALQPVRGLLRDFGTAPADKVIEDARRELWDGFPREDLP